MSYKPLKLKLRVFLAGHIVAMVTYCATKLTATCSPMIGQFIDTMMLASTGKSLDKSRNHDNLDTGNRGSTVVNNDTGSPAHIKVFSISKFFNKW